MEVKEESEKAGLKLNIQKMKFMAGAEIYSTRPLMSRLWCQLSAEKDGI